MIIDMEIGVVETMGDSRVIVKKFASKIWQNPVLNAYNVISLRITLIGHACTTISAKLISQSLESGQIHAKGRFP